MLQNCKIRQKHAFKKKEISITESAAGLSAISFWAEPQKDAATIPNAIDIPVLYNLYINNLEFITGEVEI